LQHIRDASLNEVASLRFAPLRFTSIALAMESVALLRTAPRMLAYDAEAVRPFRGFDCSRSAT
jgi:hypothetical protein